MRSVLLWNHPLQARAPSGEFTPFSISGLQAFFESDDGTVSVATWDDQTSNDNDLSAYNAENRPSIIAAELNGKSIVRFDGTDDYFHLEDNLSLTSFTLALVVKQAAAYDGVTYNNRGLFTWGPDTIASAIGGGGLLLNHDLGTLDFYAASATNDADLSAAFSAEVWHTVILTASPTEVNLYIDGVLADTDATANAGWLLTEAYLGAYVIGIEDPALFAQIDVASLAIYDSVLTAPARANLLSYLETKWAL